jgi:hypothetical protein
VHTGVGTRNTVSTAWLAGAEDDRRQGKRHSLAGVWTRACEPLGSQGAARPVVAELAVACQERHPRLAQVWVAHACTGTWFPGPRHSAAERARCGGAMALAPARKVGTGRPRAGYEWVGGGTWRLNSDTGSKGRANGGRWPTGVLGEARRDVGWFVAETRRCREVQCSSRSSRSSYRALIRWRRRVPGGAPPSPRLPLLGSSISWRGAGQATSALLLFFLAPGSPLLHFSLSSSSSWFLWRRKGKSTPRWL